MPLSRNNYKECIKGRGLCLIIIQRNIKTHKSLAVIPTVGDRLRAWPYWKLFLLFWKLFGFFLEVFYFYFITNLSFNVFNVGDWNHFTYSARRPRTSRGRSNLGPYVSFPDVLIRRGRRKVVASTSRQNRTYEWRSTDAGT